MTGSTGYDAFAGRKRAADFPAADDVGAVLRSLRVQRRALQRHCDDAKDCQAAEPDLEIANQMEEMVQNVAGALGKLDKAIPALERVQANLARYPAVVERMGDVVRQVRAARRR